MKGWLDKYQVGGVINSTVAATEEPVLGMQGMMKSKMATASAMNNPSAKRMGQLYPQSYIFTGSEDPRVESGERGTHFMSSMGEYAVPFIQQQGSRLQYNPNANYRDKEAIKFDNNADAEYFAEHYKDVAPMMRSADQYKNGGWLNQYKEGGKAGKKQWKQSDKATVDVPTPRGVSAAPIPQFENRNLTPTPAPLSDYEQQVQAIQNRQANTTPIGAKPSIRQSAQHYLDKVNRAAPGAYEVIPRMLTYPAQALLNLSQPSKYFEGADGNPQVGFVGAGNMMMDVGAVISVIPKRFKANPNAHYRSLGEEGFRDAEQVGALRPKPDYDASGNIVSKFAPDDKWGNARYSIGKPIKGYNSPMVEVTNPELFNPYGNEGHIDNIPITTSKQNIPLNHPDVKLYKKDWLRGYREIDKPKTYIESNVPHDLYNSSVEVKANNYSPNNPSTLNTPNKWLDSKYGDFGKMEEGRVRSKNPTTQEDILNSDNPLVDLYRIQSKNAKTTAQLSAEGKLPQWANNPEYLARKAAEEKHFGQWFTSEPKDLEWYRGDREWLPEDIEQINLRVPKSQLSEYQNFDKTLSRAPDREYVIPQDIQGKFRKQQHGGSVQPAGMYKQYKKGGWLRNY